MLDKARKKRIRLIRQGEAGVVKPIQVKEEAGKARQEQASNRYASHGKGWVCNARQGKGSPIETVI